MIRLYSYLLFSFICCLVLASSAAGGENPCLTCHASFKKLARIVHEALNMGCEACHQPAEGMPHPGKKGSMKLMQDVPDLCYTCHDRSKFSNKFIHTPVKDGMCTVCHNPHQTDISRLLVSEVPQLCYNCHGNKAAKKNVHAPTSRGQCSYCHSIHASNSTSLLPRDLLHLNDLCVRCHTKQARGVHLLQGPRGNHPMWKKPDPSRPGKDMSCASCHDPHSSDFPKLMPQANLCGRCHKY